MRSIAVTYPIRRILVAVREPVARDFPAAHKAAQLARRLNAELCLFHAIATPVYAETLLLSREPLVQVSELAMIASARSAGAPRRLPAHRRPQGHYRHRLGLPCLGCHHPCSHWLPCRPRGGGMSSCYPSLRLVSALHRLGPRANLPSANTFSEGQQALSSLSRSGGRGSHPRPRQGRRPR